MPSSFKLGRVAGIEIGIHYTWVFAFVLITWSLADGYFPDAYAGWSQPTYWAVSAVAALALFASVLIHELMHSFVALARGLEVSSITLFIFGGVSNLKTEAHTAADEFLVTIVGPITSLALGGLFWLLLQQVRPADSTLGGILAYLASVNLLLGLFNLLPGFPLDGGRVLRSIVWGATGNMQRATAIASYVGQAIGFLLMVIGISRMFSGGFVNGLWLVFIGWFLDNAAASARQSQALVESLRGVQVAELMDPSPPTAAPEETVHEFVFRDVIHGRRVVLVEHQHELLGIVSITDAKELPQEEWASTTLRSIMTPVPLQTAQPDDDATEALQALGAGGHNQLPVVRDGQVVGMLSRADMLSFVHTRHQLGIGSQFPRSSHQA